MSVTVEQITNKLRTLPEHTLERAYGYVEALSENLSDGEVPEWQKTIVAERLAKYQKQPDLK